MLLYMFQDTLIEMILKDMYDWVKPKSVIPVHGEHRHMMNI